MNSIIKICYNIFSKETNEINEKYKRLKDKLDIIEARFNYETSNYN